MALLRRRQTWPKKSSSFAFFEITFWEGEQGGMRQKCGLGAKVPIVKQPYGFRGHVGSKVVLEWTIFVRKVRRAKEIV